MTDSSIVEPGKSSYSLPKPETVSSAEVPQMDMNRVLPRQQSTGLARGVQQLGSPNIYVDSGNEQIITADTVGQSILPRVLMGNQSIFGDGFYVSKPNIDVTTAKAGDLVFNSNQNVFKIVQTDTINLQFISAAFSAFTLNHDLGFAPIPMAYLVNVDDGFSASNANEPLPTWASVSVDTINVSVDFESWLSITANKQSAFFTCINATGLVIGPFLIRYYLLQETSGTN